MITNPVMVLREFWTFLFYDLTDPRTYDWPLLQDPVYGLSIIGFYLYFVLNLGPKLMQNRQAFHFPNILKWYNIFQILSNLFLLHQVLDAAWLKYSWKCEPVDFSNTPEALRVARLVYFYFLLKMVDLLDTVFFVLRKKNNQISFLHVHHHVTLIMLTWGGAKYFPGGHLTFIGPINCLVHVIMYFYYFMSSMGPKYQKYLWWKKYITLIQLIQFVAIFLHSIQLLFYDCGYPRWLLILFMPNNIYLYYLFKKFYKENYTNNVKVGANARTD